MKAMVAFLHAVIYLYIIVIDPYALQGHGGLEAIQTNTGWGRGHRG